MNSPDDSKTRARRWSSFRDGGALLATAVLLVTVGISVVGLDTAQALRATFENPLSAPIFFHLFMVHDGAGAVVLLLCVLAGCGAVAFGGVRYCEGLLRWLSRHGVAVSIGLVPVLALGSVFVYRDHPLAMDEYAPLLQARIFAAGEIAGQWPPEMMERLIPPHFRETGSFIVHSPVTGRVAATYWPGLALLQAPFASLGVPWLLNPILGGLTVYLLWLLARRFFRDELAPGWAVLLGVGSTALTVNAISYYSMTAHCAANLAFVWLLTSGRWRRIVLAGVVGSVALVLHQPIPHALFAAPWLAALLVQRKFRDLLGLALGYLPIAVVLGIGWTQLQGGINESGAANELGAALAENPVQRIIEGFLSTLVIPTGNLLVVRFLGFLKLFLWAVPALPLLALLGWRDAAQRRSWEPQTRSFCHRLAASALLTLLFYFFVRFDQGHGWGYRYFHSAFGALPLLATAFLVAPRVDRDRWTKGVCVASVAALLLSTGLRFAQVQAFQDRHLAQVAQSEEPGRQIRFVDLRTGYYAQDLVQNDPFLRDDVLTLVSFGFEEDARWVRQLDPDAELVDRRGQSSAWRVARP